MKILGFRLIIICLIILFINCSEDSHTCMVNIDEIDFTFGLDYEHPDKYLISGEQSDLSIENLEEIKSEIGIPNNTIDGILLVCHWVNQNFNFENAGGAMIGKNTVDELFEIRTFYGCHSLSLIISSILRKTGFPSIMIETADIQWGYDQKEGSTSYFKGHVMTEVYVNNKWILLDNNCTYITNYDYSDPYISVINSNDKGWFVFAKGVDTWEYSNKDESFTNTEMLYFSDNIHCFEKLFYSQNYNWSN